MSERPPRTTAAAQAVAVAAAVVVVIVLDPLGRLAGLADLGSISPPDMPGWLHWIGDLPGPGLLIVIVVLCALGEVGRRRRDST